MRFPLSSRFLADRDRFALRHCCEECAYLCPGCGECTQGWPTAEHRRAHYRKAGQGELVFCKEFELALEA